MQQQSLVEQSCYILSAKDKKNKTKKNNKKKTKKQTYTFICKILY